MTTPVGATPAASGIEALREGRGDVGTLIGLGVQCLLAGDAQTAAAFARAARFADAERVAPLRLLGQALANLGDTTQATQLLVESLSESLAAVPRADEAALWTAPLNESTTRIALGRVLCASSRTADAIPEFERAVELEPGSGVALAHLGEALAQAKRYPQALDALNRAIALDPQCGFAHTSLGETLIEVGRFAAALKPLERALALDDRRGAPAVAFGHALVRMGKLAESLPWFNRAIEIEPTCAEAFRHLGRTLAALRADTEALACIRAARQLRGGDWPDTWMDEAGLLLRRGDFRAGWRAYENREEPLGCGIMTFSAVNRALL